MFWVCVEAADTDTDIRDTTIYRELTVKGNIIYYMYVYMRANSAKSDSDSAAK